MNLDKPTKPVYDEENRQYQVDRINSFMDKYYSLIQGSPISQEELDRWIETLPTEQQEEIQVTGRYGFEDNKDFLEYTLNSRGISLEENLKENLSEEDYQFWKDNLLEKNKK